MVSKTDKSSEINNFFFHANLFLIFTMQTHVYVKNVTEHARTQSLHGYLFYIHCPSLVPKFITKEKEIRYSKRNLAPHGLCHMLNDSMSLTSCARDT